MVVLLDPLMVKLNQVIELSEADFDQMEALRSVDRHWSLLSRVKKRVNAEVLTFFKVGDVVLFHIS